MVTHHHFEIVIPRDQEGLIITDALTALNIGGAKTPMNALEADDAAFQRWILGEMGGCWVTNRLRYRMAAVQMIEFFSKLSETHFDQGGGDTCENGAGTRTEGADK